MSLLDRVQSLPDVLRWEIARYIQHPAAEIVSTAYEEKQMVINCRHCRCNSCRRRRCRMQYPHSNHWRMIYTIQHYPHSCICEDRLEKKEDIRIVEAWLSAWNDINVRKICGMGKRPLRTSYGKKVNYIQNLKRVCYVHNNSCFHVEWVPARCRKSRRECFRKY